MGMGLGDRERIGHVQFQVCFLGGESNYDSCPIACEIRTTGQNIRIRYLSAIDQFCYELSNDFLEPTEIVDCHGEFLEGSHKTMAGYGTKMGYEYDPGAKFGSRPSRSLPPDTGA
jgi:hypothetical protein